MTAHNPRVVVIVLNWKGAGDTIECLESVSQISYPNYKVVVLDNGSGDDSAEKIRAYTQGNIAVCSPLVSYDSTNKPIPLVEVHLGAEGVPMRYEACAADLAPIGSILLLLSPVNLGFAEGNNVAIRFALQHEEPDFIILLNNDTVVDPMFVSELVRVAESDPSIGVVGSRLLWYERNGRRDVVQFAGGFVELGHYPGYYPFLESDPSAGYPGHVIQSDYASGAALLMKPKAVPFFLLDSTYFFGCEDIDYCLRLASVGFKTVVAPQSTVWHKGGVARRLRFSGRGLSQALADTITNLRFLALHRPKWFLRVPVYLLEIAFVVGLRRGGEHLAGWRGARHDALVRSR